jgi:signal transduction histidine kinase
MDIQNIASFQVDPIAVLAPFSRIPAKGRSRSVPAAAHKSSGNFISAISHEIRNPLTNINLSVGLLQEALKDKDLKMYLDIIMRNSKRIDDLVTDLLKTQNSEIVPVAYHSIYQLLEEVLETAADRITLKNITVHKLYAPDDFKIAFSRQEMKIALTNIVINAIEAMPEGKGELTLATTSTADHYIIHIEDNGRGISEQNLKHLFKPYFTDRPGGLGLGLSTAYATLRSNDVTVNVTSKQGTGTIFTLLFDQPS